MKKVLIPVLTLALLSACSDNKDKNKTIEKADEQTTGTAGSEVSNEDKAIKEWLMGKVWKAESGAAPFSVLKVFSLDSCGYATGKNYHYTFKKGVFEMFGAQWPLTRVNDSTFTIYVEPTQKTYSYKFDSNL